MTYLKNRFGLPGALVALLALVGCLISGTFVAVIVVKDGDFTTRSQFYFYDVDLNDNEIWSDHKDDIKRIETIGFESWITNNEPVQRTFSVWLDEKGPDTLNTIAELKADAYLVLDNMKLKAGPGVQTHVTYGKSFSLLKNVDVMKKLVEAGQFHYYGVSDGGLPSGYRIDSVKVVITFIAGT